MSTVEDRLVQCFTLAMPNLAADAAIHASRTTVAEWDSLTTAGLLSLVEEEFGISIPAEDIEEFTSFERILNLINQLGMR